MPAGNRNKPRVPVVNPDSRQHLRASARSLPERPGVYLMRDSGGSVIYVGKAVNLRRRVSSYATDSGMSDRKVSNLVSQFSSLHYIPTDSELEALLVESRLIKAYHPLFNRQLIEPESCCYIRVDRAQEYPCVEVVYIREEDGADYIGPLWKSAVVHQAVEGVSDTFRLRRCSGPLPKSGKRVCPYYEFRKCAGPCMGRISGETYIEKLSAAWNCLNGVSHEALQRLRERRDEHIGGLRFERAGDIHHQMRALEYVNAACVTTLGPSDAFSIVAPSYLRGRPIVLVFRDGRLAWKALGSPRAYPDQSILIDRLDHAARSECDLLPGRPTVDDLLIIQSYLRRTDPFSQIVQLDAGEPLTSLAKRLVDTLNTCRRTTSRQNP